MNRNIQSAYAKKVLGVLLAVLVSASSISVVVFDATEVSVNANPETTVGGIFWENTTWTLDNSPYIVTDTVQIPENVVLTIEPGVVVESALNSSEDFMFVLHGKIIARGTADNKIVFDGGCVATGFSQDSSSYGSSFFTTSGALSDSQLILDHCVIKNGNRFYWGTRGHLNLTNSELTNLGLIFWGYNGRSQIYYPGQDVYIQNNLFINTTGFEIANLNADVFIRYNLFTENRESLVWNTEGGGQSRTFINYNSFIDVSGTVLRLSTLGEDVLLDATNNYWGTTNTSLIESLILDGNDDINIRGVIEYSPTLTEPHPDAPTLSTHTEVSGIITSDTTWTRAKSPYIVTGDVFIAENITLTFETGVEVKFVGYYGILLGSRATLQAYGTEENPIRFTSNGTNSQGAWKGILIHAGTENSRIYLNYTILEFAEKAVGFTVSSGDRKSCEVVIENSELINNTEGVGFSTPYKVDESNISVNGSVIEGNNLGLNLNSPFFSCKIVLFNNLVSDNGVGIRLDDGVHANTSVYMQRNTIIWNNNGIQIGEGGSSGLGLGAQVHITQNLVTKNTVGIDVTIYHHYLGGILLINTNNLYSNTEYNFEVFTDYGVYLEHNATYNWWGTTEAASISQTIYDFNDDFNLGKVAFVPFLTEPNPEAPTLDTYTEVGGIIESDTTWTFDGSPYIFTDDVTVAQNTTLTITPGAIVNLDIWSLKIEGTLYARGNETHRIMLQSDEKTIKAWPPRIYFNSSEPWNETTRTGCIIEYAEIDVVNFQYETILGDCPKISNNLIFNYGNDAAAVRTDGITIQNTIMGGYRGLVAENGQILYNTIKDADVGICCGFMSSDPIYQPTIIGNLILNNSVGIDDWSSSPYIANNTIVNNTYGIHFTTYAFYRNAMPVEIVYNNIHSNNYNIMVEYEDPQITLNMTYNWWGTANTAEINQTIYDFNDDFTLSKVNFIPFLTEPNPETIPIPEFPSWVLLSLLITATLLIIICKQKLPKTPSQQSY